MEKGVVIRNDKDKTKTKGAKTWHTKFKFPFPHVFSLSPFPLKRVPTVTA